MRQEISWPTRQLSACQGELCAMELLPHMEKNKALQKMTSVCPELMRK